MKKLALLVIALSLTVMTLNVSAKKKKSGTKSADPYEWLYPMCKPNVFNLTDTSGVYVNREYGVGWGAPILKPNFIVGEWSFKALNKRIAKQERKSKPFNARKKDPWAWVYPHCQRGIFDAENKAHIRINRVGGKKNGAPRLQAYMIIDGTDFDKLWGQIENQKRGY